MTQIKATLLTGGNHIETVSFPCSDDEIMRLTEQNEIGHKATVFINNLIGPKGLKSIEGTYASGLDSFGGQPHNIWNNFPIIHKASERLQTVVIENKDFEKLIAQYDRPNTIFYLDPPYFETEDYYEEVGFTKADHVRLRDALMQIQGKFLLSYNDCSEIRELYSRDGIMIESTTRLSNIAQRYDAGKQYPELFISNYDTYEEGWNAKQLTLFDDDSISEKILKERKIVWKGN